MTMGSRSDAARKAWATRRAGGGGAKVSIKAVGKRTGRIKLGKKVGTAAQRREIAGNIRAARAHARASNKTKSSERMRIHTRLANEGRDHTIKLRKKYGIGESSALLGAKTRAYKRVSRPKRLYKR
jgi:hypothetical protein